MIRLFLIFIVLLLSFWLGLQLSQEPGYVLISHKTYTLEMPLWLMVVLIFLAMLSLNIIFKLFSFTMKVWHFIPNWLQKRRLKKAREYTIQGLVEVREGKWELAEKHLSKVANNSLSPMLNFLSAARSSQELGDLEKRDYYIKKAYSVCNGDELAVQFTQINLYLDNKEYELALAHLENIISDNPDNTYALKLLCQIYSRTSDWQSLVALIPKLKKHNVIAQEELLKLEKEAFENVLEELLTKNIDKYPVEFAKLPRYIRNDPDFIRLNIHYLILQNSYADAEKLLLKTLKNQWSEKLILLYANIESTDSMKQLNSAEKFLKTHHESVALQTTLGRIAKKAKLWEKAKSYYQESLHLRPDAKIYAELGALLNIMGEYDLSAQCYKKGLESVI